MTVLKETSGETRACDGCGRTLGGGGETLHIESFTVADPNAGGGVRHHYCPHCAANRGLTPPIASIPGWEPSATAPTDQPATE